MLDRNFQHCKSYVVVVVEAASAVDAVAAEVVVETEIGLEVDNIC